MLEPDHSFGALIYETLNPNKVVAAGMCRDILSKIPEVEVTSQLLRARKALFN